MIEADARRRYAEELTYTAHLTSPAVIEAFAQVPRERYLGPGPWRIFQPSARSYWTTPDADPRHLYHDVLVAIDEARWLNNGQPSFLAFLIQALDVHEGDHVVHVGCGTGYFTAILADSSGRRAVSRPWTLTPTSRSAVGETWRTCPTWRSSTPTVATMTPGPPMPS